MTSVGGYTYGTGSGPSGNAVVATIRLATLGKIGALTVQPVNALLSNTAGSPTTPSTQGATITLVAGQKLYLPLIRR